MPQEIILRANGLQTSYNELTVPTGGLMKAQNCMFLAPGLIGPRRGQVLAAGTFSGAGVAKEIWFYQGYAIAQNSTTKMSRSNDSGATWTDYSGSYTPPDTSLLKMKAITAGLNFYFNSTKGVYRLDSATGTPALAGGPVPGAFGVATLTTTSGGFLPASGSVAYRLTNAVKDASGRIIESRPGGRYVINNTDTANAMTTSIPFLVPSGTTTSTFFRLYRTAAQSPNPAGLTQDPGDEMHLVAERYFTSAEITAGTATVVDITPDAVAGGQLGLYTNATLDGAVQANYAPPLCKDLANFGDRVFYANTAQPQRLFLSILGCGVGSNGSTGIRIGDVLTVAGRSYRAAQTSYVTNSGFFNLSTSLSTPSANIRTTAASLAYEVNKDSSNTTIRAYVVDDAAGPGGTICFEALALDTAAFRATLQTYPFPVAIGGLVRSGGTTVTVDTVQEHGLTTGDTVRIQPTAAADANFAAGTYTVASATTTTFTYSDAGANVASTTAYTSQRLTPVPQYAWNPPPPYTYSTFAIGALSRAAGTTVTATSGSAHGLAVGNVVTIQPALASAPDSNFAAGSFTVLTVPSPTTFTYTQANAFNGVSTTAYTTGAIVVSDSDARVDRLMYSKPGQPEAVPLLNYIDIGAPGKAVLRILAQSQNLFVFKEEGTYIVSGDGASLRVDTLDTTMHVIAPDTVASVSSVIFGLTNQGVAQFTPGGADVEPMQPIAQELFQYYGVDLSTVKTTAWGGSIETDRQYLLGMPGLTDLGDQDVSPRIYAYSTAAKAWTTFEVQRWCASVDPTTDYIWYADRTTAAVALDTRGTSQLTYSDGTVSLTASAYTAATRTITVSSTTGVVAGSSISLTNAPQERVVVVSVTDSTHFVVSGTPPFSISNPTTLASRTPYECLIRWLVQDAEKPNNLKNWQEIHGHFRQHDFYTGTWTFFNETTSTGTVTDTTDGYTDTTYTFIGQPSTPKYVRRSDIPRTMRQGVYLGVQWSITEALALWTLNGVGLVYEVGNTKGGR